MRLNVYVGLRAIAYIITNECDVVKHGIKSVNISHTNYYEYLAGLPVSKRINRRMKRQARRNLWRFKSRRENLRRLLKKELGHDPQPLSQRVNLELRIKGLVEKLTNQELVNVLCQLQKKRGYKSLRGVSDNDASEYLKEIEFHENERKKHGTIAQYLRTFENHKNIIFLRQSYIDEFNAIMDRQQSEPALREKIFNIIYFQNPLKKGRVPKCDYEPNRTVTHASNPVYQEFRVWRDVLNIRIYDPERNEVEIPFELRQKWFERCNTGTNLTKASCCRDLGFKRSTQFSWFSGKMIAGNPINKMFLGIGTSLEPHPIPASFRYTLWQELFSATDDDRLAKLLQNKYGFTDHQISELLDFDFSKLGHSGFSMKAIRKLMPEMVAGTKLKDAIMQVYGKVDFKNVALRNVVLEQHYFSYKALVEQLCKDFEINEIWFEIDPLLKAGNKQRKAMAQQRRRDEKFAKENEQLSSYNLLKLKLWNESEGVSPYEPDYVIPLEELYTDKYNIDHIVPKSLLFERGYSNQVLSPVKLNEKKNRLTGLEFARVSGIEEKYRALVETMPENKQRFLLMNNEEIPADWISRRQNSDYNTKCFATIRNGQNMPNKLISRYTRQWIEPGYPEDDARHYLCKAWTLANLDQNTIEYFDHLKKESVGKDSVGLYALEPVCERIDFENAPLARPKIKFAKKTAHGYVPRFGLHGETVFGKRVFKRRDAKGKIITDVFYKVRQPVDKLTAPMVRKIMDKAIREKIEARIAEYGSHEKGIESLIDEPALHNGKPIKRVSVMQSAEKIFPLHSTDGSGKTSKSAKYNRKIDFVFNDKNRMLKINIGENGKVKKETVTLLEWINALNSGEKIERGTFWLQENDIVELRGKRYYVVGASEALMLRDIYTLSATNTYRVKVDDYKEMKKLKVNQYGDWQNSADNNEV